MLKHLSRQTERERCMHTRCQSISRDVSSHGQGEKSKSVSREIEVFPAAYVWYCSSYRLVAWKTGDLLPSRPTNRVVHWKIGQKKKIAHEYTKDTLSCKYIVWCIETGVGCLTLPSHNFFPLFLCPGIWGAHIHRRTHFSMFARCSQPLSAQPL